MTIKDLKEAIKNIPDDTTVSFNLIDSDNKTVGYNAGVEISTPDYSYMPDSHKQATIYIKISDNGGTFNEMKRRFNKEVLTKKAFARGVEKLSKQLKDRNDEIDRLRAENITLRMRCNSIGTYGAYINHRSNI